MGAPMMAIEAWPGRGRSGLEGRAACFMLEGGNYDYRARLAWVLAADPFFAWVLPSENRLRAGLPASPRD